MKKTLYILLLVLGATTGCSIKHHVASDYSQYLVNNSGKSNLPITDVRASYLVDAKTLNHQYEFRAATVGYAHLWIVEFGKMLDETLKSNDVQNSFEYLKRTNHESGLLIFFKLENYEFRHHHAYIDLNVSLTRRGETLFTKTYHAEGKSQGAKMFWGGPFAMKNATQQSTKLALDEIFRELLQDIKTTISR